MDGRGEALPEIGIADESHDRTDGRTLAGSQQDAAVKLVEVFRNKVSGAVVWMLSCQVKVSPLIGPNRCLATIRAR